MDEQEQRGERMTNFEMVREFHRAFGQQVASVPTLAGGAVEELRYDLIAEEFNELDEALIDRNIVEVADALTDLAYVVYGMADIYGIDLDACFREVHRSNMSKLGEDGKPILRADGKFLKGLNYSPPDLKTVLGIES
jgi:predicted HAD superfamily Cof-like phosphohydrolase